MARKPAQMGLFGGVCEPPRGPGGRPSYRRRTEVAEIIRNLRAGGEKVAAIALAVGLSEPTLRRVYSDELTDGADLVRAELIQAMLTKAKGGSVSAMRLAFEQLDKGAAAVPVTRKKAEPAKGKKELALDAAQTAHEGTTWGQILQ